MTDHTTDLEFHRPLPLLRQGGLAAALTLAALAATACGGGEQSGGEAAEEGQIALAEGSGAPQASIPEGTAGSSASTASSGAWIEYEVSGDASAQDREEDVMICGRGDDEVLLARSLGDWVVDIETESSGWGELSANFTVSAPSELDGLKTPGQDPRFRGKGRVVLEDKGRDRFGMPDVEGHFETEELTSRGGHSLTVKGAFRCGVM